MPTARELLGPDGPLGRRMRGYEHRAGQLAMADAVARALREHRILLCEAGTGTGKTLAYLVPAVQSGLRVVVSTATKALQEQIFHKDLPLLERHLGLEVSSVLVKGLGNYVCRRRLHELRTNLGAELTLALATSPPPLRARPSDADTPSMGDRSHTSPPRGARRRKGKGSRRGASGLAALAEPLARVEEWLETTETGDIAEMGELPEDHPVWAEITASSESRIGSGCPYYEDCFVTRLRRAADRAQLLVVNHHLLFADLSLRGDHPGGVLPPWDAAILDEAHHIEDIATGFFGVHVSSSGIERLLGDAERALGAPVGLLGDVRRSASRLFEEVGAELGDEGRAPLDAGRWRGARLEAYHVLDEGLEALGGLLASGAKSEAMRTLAARTSALRDGLARVVEPSGAQVTWCERRARSVAVAASPIDVGAILRDRLFGSGSAVVLTSASLTSAGRFDFVRARLGLDGWSDTPVEELCVESALDYGRQALLYVPTDLPEVNDAAFLSHAVDRIERLVALTGGGAFVLCTSVRNMTAIAHALGGRLRVPLLVQGSAPKGELLDRFRRAEDAVLVATMSFWEGVDVPGRALRLVVIDRIPFAVPTDPLVAARCRALEEAGQQPFAAYSLPQAAITLKQGFGRLLRSRDDWGLVAVLDRRLSARGYGRSLLASLPPVRQTASLGDATDFWHARLGRAEIA